MKKQDEVVAARREVLELVQTRGIRVAVQAAIDVCEDGKAPAPARATASGLLLRTAGLGGFGKSGEEEREKEPHEMTAEELNVAAAKAMAILSGERPPEDEDDASVFG